MPGQSKLKVPVSFMEVTGDLEEEVLGQVAVGRAQVAAGTASLPTFVVRGHVGKRGRAIPVPVAGTAFRYKLKPHERFPGGWQEGGDSSARPAPESRSTG